MVAIGGIVPLVDTLKQTHQSIDSVAIMKPVTKFSFAINSPDAAGEAVVNAFRAAIAPRQAAAFIAISRDVQALRRRPLCLRCCNCRRPEQRQPI